METVNRPELIRRISEKVNKKFTQEEILEMLRATLDSMVDIVGEGDKLVLQRYFTIYPKHCNERVVRNVKENIPITIPERYRPKIDIGCSFIDVCESLINKVNDIN